MASRRRKKQPSERFNPTVVRLVPGTQAVPVTPEPGFNPTVVRLVREPLIEHFIVSTTSFTPTVVRLVQKHITYHAMSSESFNPTVVRLVLGQWLMYITAVHPFQSHRGSISTWSRPIRKP